MRMRLHSVRFAFLLVLAVSVNGCSNYGEKLEFNKGEVYYTEGVSEADAKKLGEYLVKDGYFDGGEKSVQLQKTGDRYLFRAVILEEYLKDERTASVFELVGNQISQNVFGGAPVDIELTDEYFETKKTIPFNPSPALAGDQTAVPDSQAVAPDTATGSSQGDTTKQ